MMTMERLSMDLYLRRLKQELVSMKEVGDGLHEQMNCMMGALQELKLLQVQTALEQLEISGAPNQVSTIGQHQCCRNGREMANVGHECRPQLEPAPMLDTHSEERSSFLSSHSVNMLSPVSSSGSGQRYMVPPFRNIYSDWDPSETGSTSSTLAAKECWSPGTFQSTSSQLGSLPHTGALNVRKVSASHEPGCQDCSISDDTEDWTSSLMSQSRNRQPLVLGDNIFADLVGNWLDLPEVDKKGEKADPALSISRSQEVYRKFSLTANIFKKFLRSVRPDKSKLLKEKPCWLPADDKGTELSKRSKKGNKQKGTFYFSFHNNVQSIHSKADKCPHKEESKEKTINCTKRVYKPIDPAQAGFDINTAVWV